MSETLEITSVDASGVCVSDVKDFFVFDQRLKEVGWGDRRHTSSIVIDILPSSVWGNTLDLSLMPVPGEMGWTSFSHSSMTRPSNSIESASLAGVHFFASGL